MAIRCSIFVVAVMLTFGPVSHGQDAVGSGAALAAVEEEIEAMAVVLSGSLRDLERSARATDGGSAPELEERVREELQLASAELDRLAANIREGANCESLRPTLRRLADRRRSIIELGRESTISVLSAEELAAAKTLWEALSAGCRGAAD